MSEKTVAQKLLIKPGYKVLFWQAPEDYATWLGEIPADVKILKDFAETPDLIQLFVADRQALEEQLTRVKPILSQKTILWVTYHKGTSKVKTDINRDTVNAYAKTQGLEGIAMVSVNDDWAALRLRFAR
jgi:hypothetical protein